MPSPVSIPDGSYFLEDADQWSETSYTVRGNLVYMNYVDRKDGSVEGPAPLTIDAFLLDPTVKPWSKDWMRGLMATHSGKQAE